MSPEHQALKAEGDALARTMAHHRLAQTKPTAHQLMQVAAWEQRCSQARMAADMEELVERWIWAFNETMRQKMKEQLNNLWQTGDERSMGGIRQFVVPYEDDMLGPEVEISSYPTHIQFLPAEKLDLSMQQYGRGQRIGYSMAQLIASKPDRDDGLNRKQRRAQAAQARKPGQRGQNAELYIRKEGETEFRKFPGTITNLKWTPL